MTLLARRTVSNRGEEVTHGTLASRLREEQEGKPPVGGQKGARLQSAYVGQPSAERRGRLAPS